MRIVHLDQHGIAPNTSEDYTAALAKILQDGSADTIFRFAPGRYDFHARNALTGQYNLSNTNEPTPQKLAMLLKNMRNVELDGGGAQFVFHGQMQPITCYGCEDLRLRGFSIDWDVPLTSEAQVIAAGEGWADIRVNTESPCWCEDETLLFDIEDEQPGRLCGLMEFDAASLEVRPQTGDHGGWVESISDAGDGTFRLHMCEGATVPLPGNYLVLRHNARRHAGLFFEGCKGVRCEDIALHGTGGLGMLFQFCDEIRCENVSCVPNTARGRHVASCHDDGLHFSNCRGQIAVERCKFHGLMDDPINVHGTSAPVTEILGPRSLRCRFAHRDSLGLALWARPGERLGVLSRAHMDTIATAKVKHFALLKEDEFLLELEEDLPAEVLSEAPLALENLSNTPDFDCRDNHFGSCRARGVLVSTPGRVRILDNTFASSGSAILIAGDANQWYESGAVRDVRIAGNTFTDSCLSSMYQFCEGVISICPEIPQPLAERPFHRNIRIENNTFHVSGVPVLYAFGVRSLRFSDNAIVKSDRFPAWHPRKERFETRCCTEVEIALRSAAELTDAQRAALYPIILREYNPAWPQWFAEEKAALERLLGPENILRITHIGSTAVPGLLAKPTIDILLEITEAADMNRLLATLPEPEYIPLRKEATPGKRITIIKGYLSTGFAECVFHIHMRRPGDWDEVVFRDYLRAHPDATAEYAALKRRLQPEFEHDRDGYTEAKGAFVRAAVEKARAEGGT